MNAPGQYRLPPHSVESEQSLIGALLLDNSAWDRVADLIRESDFYRDEHRRIFRHAARLIDQGKPADVVTVFESLDKSGEAQNAGGLAYLGELANNTPSASNIRRYGEIVRERAILRKLVTVGDEIAAGALAPAGRDASLILDDAESRILAIREGVATGSGPAGMVDCLREAIEAMETAAAGNAPRYHTRLARLDRALHDFVRSALIIVAGRPGMGKTSLATVIAEAVAADEQPGAVVVFSMEMPKRQVTFRLLAQLSGVDLTKLVSGQGLTDADYSAISAAAGKLYEQRIEIDDSPALRVIDIRARCNLIRRKHGGIKLVIVDYLQLMTGDGENRTQEIGSISRGLKALAKELNVPLIALAQLSRKLEDRPSKRPQMSDLRESGSIEQDADLILFCYRDEVYDPDSADRGTAEIIIGKQRNGPAGDRVRVAWDGPTASFRNLPDGWAPAPSGPKPKMSFQRGFEE